MYLFQIILLVITLTISVLNFYHSILFRYIVQTTNIVNPALLYISSIDWLSINTIIRIIYSKDLSYVILIVFIGFIVYTDGIYYFKLNKKIYFLFKTIIFQKIVLQWFIQYKRKNQTDNCNCIICELMNCNS